MVVLEQFEYCDINQIHFCKRSKSDWLNVEDSFPAISEYSVTNISINDQ